MEAYNARLRGDNGESIRVKLSAHSIEDACNRLLKLLDNRRWRLEIQAPGNHSYLQSMITHQHRRKTMQLQPFGTWLDRFVEKHDPWLSWYYHIDGTEVTLANLVQAMKAQSPALRKRMRVVLVKADAGLSSQSVMQAVRQIVQNPALRKDAVRITHATQGEQS